MSAKTILILAANPKGSTPLRLDQEVRDIAEGLERSQHRDRFTLKQSWAVRPRDIQRAMLDNSPQIVHFSGHGEGEEGLIFEDEVGQPKLVSGAALNGIGARGQLLVTTRDARITTSIGATEHQLGLLSNPQARRPLAQWTQIPETALPLEADAVVAECGALPLALAMTGAMLRGKPDRWGNVLHKLRSADLEKIKQQFPDYPYPDLLKAIAISVDALDPALRLRYLDFALFPEAVGSINRSSHFYIYWRSPISLLRHCPRWQNHGGGRSRWQSPFLYFNNSSNCCSQLS